MTRVTCDSCARTIIVTIGHRVVDKESHGHACEVTIDGIGDESSSSKRWTLCIQCARKAADAINGLSKGAVS